MVKIRTHGGEHRQPWNLSLNKQKSCPENRSDEPEGADRTSDWKCSSGRIVFRGVEYVAGRKARLGYRVDDHRSSHCQTTKGKERN